MSSAVRNSLNGLSKVIPSNGTMDSALNITLESVKADIGKTWKESEILTYTSIILVADIEAIITKLDAECKESPCTFTEAIKTAATESLEADWTTLHEDKTAEAVQSILTTAFLDFGQYFFDFDHFLIDKIVESKFVIPPINTSSITNVTTLDELKTLVTDTFWTPLNAMCGADCGPTKVNTFCFNSTFIK